MYQRNLLSVILLSLVPWLAQADANLNLSGNVVATPCIVDAGTVNKTVDLKTAERRDMQTAGTGSEWQDFSLSVKSCPAGTSKVTATFTGTPDTQDATAWKNTGQATRVALRMTKADRTTILSNGSSILVDINSSTLDAQFPLSARMFTPQGDPGPGTFAAVVNVDFTYQ